MALILIRTMTSHVTDHLKCDPDPNPDHDDDLQVTDDMRDDPDHDDDLAGDR